MFDYHLSDYPSYLLTKGYSDQSAANYSRTVQCFCVWLAQEDLGVIQVTYNDMTSYIRFLQQRGVTMGTISNYMHHIKSYYRYLREVGVVEDNPVSAITLQGTHVQLLHHILTTEELALIWQDYPYQSTRINTQKVAFYRLRYKALLGLLIFQGLRTSELRGIKQRDVDLVKGKIIIPPTPKGATRVLNFEPQQILQLHSYMLHPLFKQADEHYLFYSGSPVSISNATADLLKKIKKAFSEVENYRQIRASVITQWIKQTNLRKAQYLAGHRYVSSTEKYRANDVESLQNEINQYQMILGS